MCCSLQVCDNGGRGIRTKQVDLRQMLEKGRGAPFSSLSRKTEVSGLTMRHVPHHFCSFLFCEMQGGNLGTTTMTHRSMQN